MRVFQQRDGLASMQKPDFARDVLLIECDGIVRASRNKLVSNAHPRASLAALIDGPRPITLLPFR